MEDGLERTMFDYDRTERDNQTQCKKKVYMCILNEGCESKRYVIIDNIELVREFTKNIACEIKICNINDIP